MSALAYLLPPISGLIAYFAGGEARVRFHGLQSVLLGFLWPAGLYIASWANDAAVLATAVAFALVWALLIVVTAAGRDPGLPGLATLLRRAAARGPGDRPPAP